MIDTEQAIYLDSTATSRQALQIWHVLLLDLEVLSIYSIQIETDDLQEINILYTRPNAIPADVHVCICIYKHSLSKHHQLEHLTD